MQPPRPPRTMTRKRARDDMTRRLTDSRLANLGAQTILLGFDEYHTEFKTITRRAKIRFEQRDWHGMFTDAAERLDLYRETVNRTVAELRELLGDRANNKLVWASMKAVYSGLIADRDDWELAETFFNSVTRRIFTTVGVDEQIEFVDTDFESPPTQARRSVYRTYRRAASTKALVEQILRDFALREPFHVPFANLSRDAALAAREIESHLRAVGALRVVERAEMVRAVFYRGKAAYLIGRLFSGSHLLPLVIALLHEPEGIVIDAVLLEENEVSILFSFARSYFHVDVERPYDLVRFLKSIMPRKRVAELYISIGYNKHGKTELYRDILNHLATTDDRFEIAPGQRGMVMAVFTLPAYDLVFKVIRDRFPPPKRTTRREVKEKYHLVFKHDRAGRLVDAQEFEYLKFDRRRFTDELLDELGRVAGQTVYVDGDYVVIRHAYVERRVIPLDIYVREADEEAAEAAVIDYGNAIKDLAATNIFPGDMLLKNFGVTRHRRVVFYDYDELCLLTDCRFRRLPPARTLEDELSGEPWFHVGPNDIFPEEFPRFWGLKGRLLEVFLEHHADLFDAEFWQQMQERIRSGEVINIFPYPQHKRLRHKYPEAFREPAVSAAAL